MEVLTTITLDAAVVGSGAAGLNAACRLKQFGVDKVAVITNGINRGTSRNTGSDKQTYYKLSMCGSGEDSVVKMAQSLFDGGAVDGDNALCEAALSARCFLQLCELGVPFPTDRFGEFAGYKTDHDDTLRATSAGPLTSKYMTEALEQHAKQMGVSFLDHMLAVDIIVNDGRAAGLVCLDLASDKLVPVNCANIIWATGGPATVYARTVYPESHTGCTGVPLAAGAAAQNLTEWQFGLASVRPRWNVSGTYMQVLPRFVSVDANGEEHEFLTEVFKTPQALLQKVFLKGYQWPFDSRKIIDGSSVIDLLVYRQEVLLGRKVYLDFTRNPYLLDELDYDALDEETRSYLQNAGACFGTPIQRLLHMNAPAVDLYLQKGVDLKKEMLQISLCAQHCNGGLSVDCWWQTNIKGLFAAGEAAGTHGVYRPGGSALNAGQVGSLRAAQFIAAHKAENLSADAFFLAAKPAVDRHKAFCGAIHGKADNARALLQDARERMDVCGGAIRTLPQMQTTLDAVKAKLADFTQTVCAENLETGYLLWDTLVTQCAVLTAMLDMAQNGGLSRGSALVYNADGILPDGLPEHFRFLPDRQTPQTVQQVVLQDGVFKTIHRDVRPVPQPDRFFENVWAGYRKTKNIE